MSNNARMTDVSAFLQAGMDPKTGLPIRMGKAACSSKDGFRKQLRILDEQQAVNRYKWYNLPSGIDGQLLERILYYKGQAMFFWLDDTDDGRGTFYFLPFALNGTIDVYGRFNDVTPLPFNGTAQDSKDAWITGLTRKVVKELPLEVDIDMYTDGCVLLGDYTKQISQTNIPRQILQEPVLDMMSDVFPLVRTNLFANSGIKGMRVTTEDDQSNVLAANKSIERAALTGEYFIPIVASTEVQDLTSSQGNNKSQEYLMTLQALDNYRLGLYGIQNGGVFDKSQYVNTTQAGAAMNTAQFPYQDGLTIRQSFCDMINSIWGLSVWCDTSELATIADKDMNGEVIDKQDQSGAVEGEQPEGSVETDE